MKPSGQGPAGDAPGGRRLETPLTRAVLWRPQGHGPADPRSAGYPLFVTQRLLTDLVAASGWSGGAFGFLIGQLCQDPASGERYVVASHHLRLSQPFHGDETQPPLLAGLDAATAEAARVGGALLGWYHSHAGLPLAPTNGDLVTHRKHFREPWELMLVVGRAGGGGAVSGWWFRPQSAERRPLAFYELFDAPAPPAGGAKVSRMGWTGYTPDDPAIVVTPQGGETRDQPSQLLAHFIHPEEFTPVDDEDDDGPPDARRSHRAAPRLTGEMMWQATGQWGVWGRVGVLSGAALMVVLMGYGLYAFAVGGRPAPVMVSAPPAAPASAPVSPERAELETAMRGFADADRMFAAGQATCDVLGRSLVRVEEAWLAYNTARRNAAGASTNLAAAVAGDDQALVDAVDTVAVRFERSACPRP